MHATWKLDQIGDPNARFFHQVANYYWDRLPPAPQWRRSPTAPLDDEEPPERGRLEPSELAWLQTFVADKRPDDLDETTIRNLARLTTKAADTPDSLYLGELFRPVAEFHDQLTDAANKRLAQTLSPTVLDDNTRATLTKIAGEYLADRRSNQDSPSAGGYARSNRPLALDSVCSDLSSTAHGSPSSRVQRPRRGSDLQCVIGAVGIPPRWFPAWTALSIVGRALKGAMDRRNCVVREGRWQNGVLVET